MGKQDVCPGCSRHCPLDHVRCKYGQKYIEKQRRALEGAPGNQKQDSKKMRRRKWEKYAAKGSASWTLFETSSRLKRALRKETITERQIHLALSDEEQAQLRALLAKISGILE